MSQESNHGHEHQADKPAVSFSASIWVVIILVGVFICAVNFVKVMSSEGEEGTKTEMAKPAGEAPETKTSSNEATMPGKTVENAAKTDTAKH